MESLNKNDFTLALSILHPTGYEWPDPGLPCPGENYEEFTAAYGSNPPTEAQIIEARDTALARIATIKAVSRLRSNLAERFAKVKAFLIAALSELTQTTRFHER